MARPLNSIDAHEFAKILIDSAMPINLRIEVPVYVAGARGEVSVSSFLVHTTWSSPMHDPGTTIICRKSDGDIVAGA